MNATEALSHIENKKVPVPPELIPAIIGLLPQILELLSRKNLRKQVEVQGKLIQLILQKNTEQDARITALENKQ